MKATVWRSYQSVWIVPVLPTCCVSIGIAMMPALILSLTTGASRWRQGYAHHSVWKVESWCLCRLACEGNKRTMRSRKTHPSSSTHLRFFTSLPRRSYGRHPAHVTQSSLHETHYWTMGSYSASGNVLYSTELSAPCACKGTPCWWCARTPGNPLSPIYEWRQHKSLLARPPPRASLGPQHSRLGTPCLCYRIYARCLAAPYIHLWCFQRLFSKSYSRY